MKMFGARIRVATLGGLTVLSACVPNVQNAGSTGANSFQLVGTPTVGDDDLVLRLGGTCAAEQILNLTHEALLQKSVSIACSADGVFELEAALAFKYVGQTLHLALSLQSPPSASQSFSVKVPEAPSTTLSATVVLWSQDALSSEVVGLLRFNRPVSGFDSKDIYVDSGTKSVTGKGSDYEVRLKPGRNIGTLKMGLLARGAKDAFDQLNEGFEESGIPFNFTRPTLTMSGTSYISMASLQVTLNFSHPVSEFDVSDLQIMNATSATLSGSGATYLLSLVPEAPGEILVSLPEARVRDSYGNPNLASSSFRSHYLTGGPVATWTGPLKSTTSPVVLGLQFDREVIGLNTQDILATNATVEVSGTGASYNVWVYPTGQGLVTLLLPEGAATGVDTNPTQATQTRELLFDSVRPTTTWTAPTTATASPITLQLSFSEPVTGLLADDFVLTNAQISALTSSGLTTSVSLVPTAQGNVSLQLRAGAVMDGHGNGNLVSAPPAILFDSVRPTATWSGSSAPTTYPFVVGLNFSEAVTGLTQADIQLSGGTFSLAGSGSSYSLSVSPSAPGATLHFRLAEGLVSDSVGFTNLEAALFTATYSPVVPVHDILVTQDSGDMIKVGIQCQVGNCQSVKWGSQSNPASWTHPAVASVWLYNCSMESSRELTIYSQVVSDQGVPSAVVSKALTLARRDSSFTGLRALGVSIVHPLCELGIDTLNALQTNYSDYVKTAFQALAPATFVEADRELFSSYSSDADSVRSTRYLSNWDFSGVIHSPIQGGTMLTRKHYAHATHYMHAVNTELKLHGPDGVRYLRTVISQGNLPATGYIPDIAIGKLSADVPSPIANYAIMDPRIDVTTQLVGSPYFLVEQNRRVFVHKINSASSRSIYGTNDTGLPSFMAKTLVGGDSGKPCFLPLANKLVLMSTHTFAGYGNGPYYGQSENQTGIQTLLQQLGQ